MRDALLDLVLGSTCAGCGRPGRLLCPECRQLLPRGGHQAWPTPCPPGLAPPWAGGEYDGLLKVLVNAHKEHAQFALARPLGEVLARVVADLVGRQDVHEEWLLVPVPSRRSVVRRRGHDPMLRVSRGAAGVLRRCGLRVQVARLLVVAAATADQAGLGAGARAANLAGAMRAKPGPARWARTGGRRVVVVDDVLTTGSTAREAQRALEQHDLAVCAVATIAATRKKVPVPRAGAPREDRDDSGGSLPILGAGG